MSTTAPTLVWLRQDLRLSDNPALVEAAKNGTILPIFILDDKVAGKWAYGAASRWWLHHSLESLVRDLNTLKMPLILRRGDATEILDALILETGARTVVWNRRYEPWAIAQDTRIKDALTQRGITVKSSNGKLLTEPWEIKTYKVFTPYWKACLAKFNEAPPSFPLPVPENMASPKKIPASDHLASWNLLPHAPDWAGGMREAWLEHGIGEKAAQKRLHDFLDDTITDYSKGRDYPSAQNTSRLSPHLAFGEISPRQIWHAVHAAIHSGQIKTRDTSMADHFLREIGWREFSYHLLYHFPTLPDKPLQEKFARFPWLENHDDLEKWQRGKTGYPIVDAGMRELWQTGWMHNRVRMIVGSFLVKNLLLDWRSGMEWFWDTLVDADLANNTCSWQWIAGCGADAAPYFRIFNPILQSEKFDAGDYIRRYVPELKNISDDFIHTAWKAPDFKKTHYPAPIIDHGFARKRALEALAETKP